MLKNLDMVIESGKSTAIIGESGSGKSTLVKLLCRFYDVNSGAVHWNGHDVRQLDPFQVRSVLG